VIIHNSVPRRQPKWFPIRLILKEYIRPLPEKEMETIVPSEDPNQRAQVFLVRSSNAESVSTCVNVNGANAAKNTEICGMLAENAKRRMVNWTVDR
jgi:hypothetical protein